MEWGKRAQYKRYRREKKRRGEVRRGFEEDEWREVRGRSENCGQLDKRFIHSLCSYGENLNKDLHIFFATWIHGTCRNLRNVWCLLRGLYLGSTKS